jgi:AraC-like DNA-binding protein
MDVLSEVLSAVRLRGALFFNAEFSAPWCMRSAGAVGMTPYLSFKDAHLIMFHFLTEGRAYAALEDGERVELNGGDIVILPGGDSHLLGNGSPKQTVDSFRTFAKHVEDGLKVVRFGGGGEKTKFVCGYMACDPRLCEVFLSGLPRILRVPVGSGPSGKWIENSIRFSVDASAESDEGSSLVVGKLSEVLFVETLRGYISTLPSKQTGWLAGLRDAIVAKALALLHRDPARNWTVDTLAREVGSSRTRLADRFRHFLEISPMTYLTDWRMKLGAEALQRTDKSVVEIAMDVGYSSEAAFNRAFKRAYNTPPAQFRQGTKNGRTQSKGDSERTPGPGRRRP